MAEFDAFVLTNNPKWFELDADQLADWIEATGRGEVVEENWSTGGTKKKIAPGDRAYLLRQGSSDRGVFASGVFTSSVYQDWHWRESGTLANYAYVEWDAVVDPKDALPTELLQSAFPDVEWNPRASGTQIPTSVVAQLESMWQEHLATVLSSVSIVRPQPTGGAGYGRKADAKLRKQIEDLAQRRFTDYFSSLGWDVEDMRAGNPFDAQATRDDLSRSQRNSDGWPEGNRDEERSCLRSGSPWEMHHGSCVRYRTGERHGGGSCKWAAQTISMERGRGSPCSSDL